MRIETGTTWDRRFRISLFLLMCGGMSAWFAYDGLKAWPAQNLEWARQKVPGKLEDLQTNPLAMKDNLGRVEAGMTIEELRGLLGEPALIQPRCLRYVGPEVVAVIELDDDENVIRVTTDSADLQTQPDSPNSLVTAARLEYVKEGMPAAQVKRHLAQPTADMKKAWWYIGPAAYAEIRVADGKVAGEPNIQISDKHSETDIQLQKIIAAVLALAAIGVAIKLYLIMKMHIVLDDTGLTMNSRHIAWDAMTGLVTDDYKRKGWLDLAYSSHGSTRSIRLDSYHIEHFDEIVNTICQRKGYESPIKPSGDDEPGPSPVEPAPDDTPDE